MRVNLLEIEKLDVEDIKNLKTSNPLDLLGLESGAASQEVEERCRQLSDKFNPEKSNDAVCSKELASQVMELITAAKEDLVGSWETDYAQKSDESEQKAIRLKNQRAKLEHQHAEEREELSLREKEERDLLTQSENKEFQVLSETMKKAVSVLKSNECDENFNAQRDAIKEANKKDADNFDKDQFSQGNWSEEPTSPQVMKKPIDVASNTASSFYPISQMTLSAEPTDTLEKINLASAVRLVSKKGGIDPKTLQLGVSNLDIVGCEIKKDLLKDHEPASTTDSKTRIRADQRYQYITSSAVVYKNANHAVLNIGTPLDLGKDTFVGDVSKPEHFQTFFSDLVDAKIIKERIDCIQMPMILTENGRKHFVQVQFFNYRREQATTVKGIYKTQAVSELGVRVIDSTGNPFNIPNKRLKKFVEQVGFDVSVLLKIKSRNRNHENATKSDGKVSSKTNKGKFRIHTVFTEEQSSRPVISPDKKCGLYVLGGVKAVTDKVLMKGDDFLSDDKEVVHTVSNEHHCVNKSRVENYFLSRVLRNVFSDDDQNKEVSKNFNALCDELNLGDAALAKKGESDAASTRNENTSSSYASQPRLEPHDISSSVLPIFGKGVPSDDPIINSDPIIKIVKEALKGYKKNHRTFGSLFRHISSSGLRYVEQAESRIDSCGKENQAAVCKQIAKEILAQALTSDGCIKVDRNSRVYWLLKEMNSEGIISSDVENMMGKEVKIEDITQDHYSPLIMTDN